MLGGLVEKGEKRVRKGPTNGEKRGCRRRKNMFTAKTEEVLLLLSVVVVVCSHRESCQDNLARVA